MESIIKANEMIKANQISTFTVFLNQITAKLNSGLVIANNDILKRDLANKFKKKGDKVELTVRIPSTVAEHSDSGNTATDFQEGKRLVELDYIPTVDHVFTFDELQQELSEGKTEVIDSMVDGMIDDIESYALGKLYKRSIGYEGTAGTTMSAYSTILGLNKRLNLNRAPFGNRNGIVDSTTAAAMLDLPEWTDTSVAGSSASLIEASLGRKARINWFEGYFVPTQATTGTFEAVNQTMAGTVVVANNSTLTDGMPYSSMEITEAATTSTAKVSEGAIGTVVDDSGVTHYFCVLEQTAAAVAGVVTAKIYPALSTACTGTVVTFAEKNKSASQRNLVIQKDCAYLTARPIEPYPDKPSITITTANGIPLRLSMWSDGTNKKTYMSLDALINVYVARPEGIVTLLG